MFIIGSRNECWAILCLQFRGLSESFTILTSGDVHGLGSRKIVFFIFLPDIIYGIVGNIFSVAELIASQVKSQSRFEKRWKNPLKTLHRNLYQLVG